MYKEDGTTVDLPKGAVSAGYQNFLICIEMFFAAIALRYAFPISVYINEGCINADGVGRSVTMQSISSSVKARQRKTRLFFKILRLLLLPALPVTHHV